MDRLLEDDGIGIYGEPTVEKEEKSMQEALTVQWVQEKMGALYMGNLQLLDAIQRLTAENEALKQKPVEPDAENK